MTNTRIADPEIIERRYPVILLHFHLNPGTGGDGFYKGGDGVIRELMFRRKQFLSVLCERRSAFQPYGLQGGRPGSTGINLLIQNSGKVINIGSKTTIEVGAGDCLRIQTPGGGGYGPPLNDKT